MYFMHLAYSVELLLQAEWSFNPKFFNQSWGWRGKENSYLTSVVDAVSRRSFSLFGSATFLSVSLSCQWFNLH